MDLDVILYKVPVLLSASRVESIETKYIRSVRFCPYISSRSLTHKVFKDQILLNSFFNFGYPIYSVEYRKNIN